MRSSIKREEGDRAGVLVEAAAAAAVGRGEEHVADDCNVDRRPF